MYNPGLASEDAHDLGGNVQEEDGRNEGECENDDDEGVAGVSWTRGVRSFTLIGREVRK